MRRWRFIRFATLALALVALCACAGTRRSKTDVAPRCRGQTPPAGGGSSTVEKSSISLGSRPTGL